MSGLQSARAKGELLLAHPFTSAVLLAALFGLLRYQLLSRGDLNPLLGYSLLTAIQVILLYLALSLYSRKRSALGRLREQHAQLRRESDSQYRVFFNSTSCGVMMADPDGRILRASPTLLAMTGYSEEELLKKTVAEITAPEDLEETRREFGRLISGEYPVIDLQKRYRRKDGSFFWGRVNATAVMDSCGKTIYCVGIIRDITPEKNAQAKVQRSEQRLWQFVAQAPFEVAMFDREMRYLYASKCWMQYFKLGDGDISGKSHYELFPELPESWKEVHRRCLAGAAERSDGEAFQRADGGVNWIRWEVRPWLYHQGEIGGLIIFSEDISKQRETELAIREAEIRERAATEASRLKSEFVANISHEIRTPINGIIGMTKLLERTQLSKDQEHLLKAISNSSQLLFRLLSDILDLSKVEAGKLELEAVPFEPLGLLNEAANTFEPLAREKGLEFSCSISGGGLPSLTGDPTRLRQVLNNLLSNSIKFTERGCISLNLRHKRLPRGRVSLELEVADTGIGISTAAQKRLFEPFMQADASTSRRFGGTGLGLAISRRLIALMGGSPTLTSVPGQGTKIGFQVELPVAAEELSEASAAPRTALSAEVRGKKTVLIAEDNVINLEISKRVLELAGYQVAEAKTGFEVLNKVSEQAIDLILMDCHMPEMDGFEAVAGLRARGFHLPILALTAGAYSDDRKRSLEVGMSDHLSKPIAPRELVEAVDSWLNGSPTIHEC